MKNNINFKRVFTLSRQKSILLFSSANASHIVRLYFLRHCLWHFPSASRLSLALGIGHQFVGLCRFHAVHVSQSALFRRFAPCCQRNDSGHQQPASFLWAQLSYPFSQDGRHLSLYGLFSYRWNLFPALRLLPSSGYRQPGSRFFDFLIGSFLLGSRFRPGFPGRSMDSTGFYRHRFFHDCFICCPLIRTMQSTSAPAARFNWAFLRTNLPAADRRFQLHDSCSMCLHCHAPAVPQPYRAFRGGEKVRCPLLFMLCF